MIPLDAFRQPTTTSVPLRWIEKEADAVQPRCPICGETFAPHDLTVCDECLAPLCVHCGATRDSEDYVCPRCHRAYVARRAQEEGAATTATTAWPSRRDEP